MEDLRKELKATMAERARNSSGETYEETLAQVVAEGVRFCVRKNADTYCWELLAMAKEATSFKVAADSAAKIVAAVADAKGEEIFQNLGYEDISVPESRSKTYYNDDTNMFIEAEVTKIEGLRPEMKEITVEEYVAAAAAIIGMAGRAVRRKVLKNEDGKS